MKRKITVVDEDFKFEMDRIKRQCSIEQGIDISMRELTRRMRRAKAFKPLRDELIEDARAKRRMGF